MGRWCVATAVALCAVVFGLAVVACSSPREQVLGDQAANFIEAGAAAFGCETPNQGCPCSNEGAAAACGEVTVRSGDYLECSKGTRTCTGGHWGACVGDRVTTSSSTAGLHALNLGQSTACTNNPCDPYCNAFVDTPDGMAPPDGMVVGNGGLTLTGGSGGLDGGGATCTTATLVGTVYDPAGNHPVPNALVRVVDQNTIDIVSCDTYTGPQGMNSLPPTGPSR